MKHRFALNRWWAASALTLAFCSGGTPPSLTQPSASQPASGAASGIVGAAATGDVTVGTGALEIVRLRMDRQLGGSLVLRQFVEPGGSYSMDPGETIELWAEYPPEVPNPRFKAVWGDGADDFTGCGSCRLVHTYPRAGVFTVQASLDDRVSTTSTRTFALDSRPAATPTPTPSATPTPGPTGEQTFSYTGVAETFTVPAGVTSVTIEAWGAQGGNGGTQDGLGAYVKGTVSVAPGQVLDVVVGAKGSLNSYAASGGGGSGVSRGGSALVVAGGGGGVWSDSQCFGKANASIGTDGQPGCGDSYYAGRGLGGNGGSDGGDATYSTGGRGFNSGGTGSTGRSGPVLGSCPPDVLGSTFGLGGGGVGCRYSGGGGGYSGGGGGIGEGGGGGSFNAGTNPTNTAGVGTGNGQVKITW